MYVMARLVRAQITNCPECGTNDWLIWLTGEGDDPEPVPDRVSSGMRMIDEMRKLRHQRHWGPLSPYLRKLEPQRDAEGPTAPNLPRCFRCGFERRSIASPVEETAEESDQSL
jgi:Zn ribbon nucleic-acid-binding protein